MHQRIVSSMHWEGEDADKMPDMESNAIFYCRFGDNSAVLATDYIDQDDLHPYDTSNRIRKDVSSGVVLSGHRCQRQEVRSDEAVLDGQVPHVPPQGVPGAAGSFLCQHAQVPRHNEDAHSGPLAAQRNGLSMRRRGMSGLACMTTRSGPRSCVRRLRGERRRSPAYFGFSFFLLKWFVSPCRDCYPGWSRQQRGVECSPLKTRRTDQGRAFPWSE